MQNMQGHPNISNTLNHPMPTQENFSNYTKTEFPNQNIKYPNPNQPLHMNEMEGNLLQKDFYSQPFYI